MLNTTLPHSEPECCGNLGRAYLNLRGRRDGLATSARSNPVKVLLAGVANCSVAHWYFMPGLNFHRYRVGLSLSTIVGKRRELRNVVAKALETISPAVFLDFDFAWKAVASRGPFGTYLDYSSPWLFPAMLLAERRSVDATVLGSDPLGMEVIKRLPEGQQDRRGSTICKSINDVAFISESFDVVTSLSWIARTADDVGTVKQLWSALKPGGMLLLSLPCSSRTVEDHTGSRVRSDLPQKPEKCIGRVYDESLLQERVFAVVGQPRRCVVYGESNPRADRQLTLEGNDNIYSSSEFIAFARGWRTYSGLRDLPGEGVMAMKFIKPEIQ